MLVLIIVPTSALANQPDWVRLNIGPTATMTTPAGATTVSLPASLALGPDYEGSGSIEVHVHAPKGYLNEANSAAKQTLILNVKVSATAPNLPITLTYAGAKKLDDSAEMVVLDVTASDPSGYYPDQRFRARYQRSGSTFVPLEGPAIIASMAFSQSPELLLKAEEYTTSSMGETKRRDPSTDESLSDEERAHAAQLIAAVETGSVALAQKQGAATTAAAEVAAQTGTTGCDAGGTEDGAWVLGLALLLGGGIMARRRRAVDTPAALVALVVLSSADASASVCYADGWLSFWDMRTSYHYTDGGARHSVCQTGACNPDTPDCCWKGLSILSISLYKVSANGNWSWVATSRTIGSGYFVLWDPDCDTSATYGVGFEFSRRMYPAHLEMRIAGYTSPIRVLLSNTLFSLLPGSQNTLHLGNLALNQEGDDTPNTAATGAAWRTLWDTHLALEEEGELRFRREAGSSNAYDPIYVDLDFDPPPGRASNAACSSSTITLMDGDLWSPTPAHEMGHIAHGRVTGCTGALPAFGYGSHPSDAWKVDGPEGAMGESIAGLIHWITLWDPATTEITSLDAPGRVPCIDMTSHHGIHHFNSNDLSNPRNRVHGLWELIDTSTNNADSYADVVDATVKDLFDAMVVWSGGACVQGQNGSPCEHRATSWTAQACGFATDCVTCLDQAQGCGWADTCEYHVQLGQRYCKTGDTHGTNVADWASHLATFLGGHDVAFRRTLTSSPCVADEQNLPAVPANSPPLPNQGYFGGFHSD